MLSTWHVLVMKAFPSLFCCIIIPREDVGDELIPGDDALVPVSSGLVPSKVRRCCRGSNCLQLLV